MMRSFLIAALIAPAMLAQTPEQRLKEAWARYTQFDLVGDTGEATPPGLPGSLDELGRAWAAWAETQKPPSLELPVLAPSSGHPSAKVLGRRGAWILAGLEVPVPCGSHLFLALFKEEAGQWKLVLLDLHETRSEADLLGAREHVQTLLLDGPKVVIASTPPWCTSCWSVLHVRVEAPGADAQHPSVLGRFEDRVYRCAEGDLLGMTPVEGGIRLRYESMAGLDGTTVTRVKTLPVP